MTRSLAIVAVASLVALGTASTAHATPTTWTVRLPNWNPTDAWVVHETITNGKITGTVTPPNPSCTGAVYGTLTNGSLVAIFVYGGQCAGEASLLLGKQGAMTGGGIAFDKIIGIASAFTETVTSGSSAAVASGSCGANAACLP